MDVLLEILINSINPDILYTIHSLLPLDYYIPLIDHTFSQKWIFTDDKTYRNDKYHSFDYQPAVIYSNGDKYWWRNGKNHRNNDKPAVICANGTQYWYQNGKQHRDNDLPAVIYPNGEKVYYKNDKEYYKNI